MNTSAGIARTPYLVSVAPRVCSCNWAPKELGRFRKLDRALSTVEGYWNVYLAFFGDQQIWLNWTVVDLRDGRILWRNGRRTTEGMHDGITQDERAGTRRAS